MCASTNVLLKSNEKFGFLYTILRPVIVATRLGGHGAHDLFCCKASQKCRRAAHYFTEWLTAVWATLLIIGQFMISASVFYYHTLQPLKSTSDVIGTVSECWNYLIQFLCTSYLILVSTKYIALVQRLGVLAQPFLNLRKKLIIVGMTAGFLTLYLLLFINDIAHEIPDAHLMTSKRNVSCYFFGYCQENELKSESGWIIGIVFTICDKVDLLTTIFVRVIFTMVIIALGLCYRTIMIRIEKARKTEIHKVYKDAISSHLDFTKFISDFDVIHGPPVLFFIILDILIILSWVIHIKDGRSYPASIVAQNIFDLVSRAVSFIWVSEQAQAFKPMLEDYLHHHGHELTENDKMQAYFYLQRITSAPVEFSLVGIMSINRAFMATLVSIILTYTLFIWEVKDQGLGSQDLERVGDLIQNALSNASLLYQHRNLTNS